MLKVATLGPAETFSDLAAKKYTRAHCPNAEICFFPTIGRAFTAVGNGCDCAVLPIENMAEGYVSIVLDLLVDSSLIIVDELLLPIQFAFVANTPTLTEVEKIYAQFVTQGQCQNFLDGLACSGVITTPSNGASLDEVRRREPKTGALVASFAVKDDEFPLVIRNVADRANNVTRFVVISENAAAFDPANEYKTSLLVAESVDRPGILNEIIQAFACRDINLVSIMSRPTKEMLGRYHFFIDFEGHVDELRVREAFREVQHHNSLKILGSYPKAELPESMKSPSASCLKTRHSLTEEHNPFDDPEQPHVFVSAGQGPYENTMAALRSVHLESAAGKRVLLKPNAGRIAPYEAGVTTHPQVVAAAIDAFLEAGAEVAVGESPIAGVRTMEAFEVGGIAEVASQRGVPLIDMDARRFVEVDVPDGVAINTLKVCPEVLEFDLVISIPVMKTHMHTDVTLSVKNMKGALWRRTKVELHMLSAVTGHEDKSLNIAIADMSSILRPHLAIIDGTIGMEGLGPSGGTPQTMDVVVVGVDPFAADAVAARLMGRDPLAIPHLKIAAERGYGTVDLSQIKIEPNDWQQFGRTFAEPPENISLAYEGVDIRDENSCSACQSTLLVFLKRYGDRLLDYIPQEREMVLAIGKGHGELPSGSLCIGNCTARFKKSGVFVSGCPPVASEILNTLENERAKEEKDTLL